jgi:hypothetical protein
VLKETYKRVKKGVRTSSAGMRDSGMVTTMTMKRHEQTTKEVSVDRLSVVTEDDLVVASPEKALTNRVDCRGRCSRRDFTLLLFQRVEQLDFCLSTPHLSIIEQRHRELHVHPRSNHLLLPTYHYGLCVQKKQTQGRQASQPKGRTPLGLRYSTS